MPRAPPTSLLASFVALPTPALSEGIESITTVVAGANVKPIPKPSNAKMQARRIYSESISTVVNIAIAAVIKTSPTEMTLLLPNLATNLSLFAAAGINPIGNGKNLTAASNALWPLTS